MFKYIFFDLDGTLTDSAEGITKCVQYALKYFGIEADTEDLVDFIGPAAFRKLYEILRHDGRRSTFLHCQIPRAF